MLKRNVETGASFRVWPISVAKRSVRWPAPGPSAPVAAGRAQEAKPREAKPPPRAIIGPGDARLKRQPGGLGGLDPTVGGLPAVGGLLEDAEHDREHD